MSSVAVTLKYDLVVAAEALQYVVLVGVASASS